MSKLKMKLLGQAIREVLFELEKYEKSSQGQKIQNNHQRRRHEGKESTVAYALQV